ncbi:hypothetical protein BT69DRAFT_943975 [Atractiella rhizophila]|nr:hypothetical protein BT69DRAFT_943975 [Atractiella rhizophila]
MEAPTVADLRELKRQNSHLQAEVQYLLECIGTLPSGQDVESWIKSHNLPSETLLSSIESLQDSVSENSKVTDKLQSVKAEYEQQIQSLQDQVSALQTLCDKFQGEKRDLEARMLKEKTCRSPSKQTGRQTVGMLDPMSPKKSLPAMASMESLRLLFAHQPPTSPARSPRSKSNAKCTVSMSKFERMRKRFEDVKKDFTETSAHYQEQRRKWLSYTSWWNKTKRAIADREGKENQLEMRSPLHKKRKAVEPLPTSPQSKRIRTEKDKSSPPSTPQTISRQALHPATPKVPLFPNRLSNDAKSPPRSPAHAEAINIQDNPVKSEIAEANLGNPTPTTEEAGPARTARTIHETPLNATFKRGKGLGLASADTGSSKKSPAVSDTAWIRKSDKSKGGDPWAIRYSVRVRKACPFATCASGGGRREYSGDADRGS